MGRGVLIVVMINNGSWLEDPWQPGGWYGIGYGIGYWVGIGYGYGKRTRVWVWVWEARSGSHVCRLKANRKEFYT